MRTIILSIFLSTTFFSQVVFPAKKNRMAEESDSSDSDGGHYEGSVGIGLGLKSFSATASLARYFNPFLGIGISGQYSSIVEGNRKNIYYGPELDALLKVANPTIVTPVAGIGPGYETWNRSEDDTSFDKSSSLTYHYFVGAYLSLTRQLRLSVTQKWTTYLNDPPYQFGDHTQREPRNKANLNVGFGFSF